MMRVRIVLAAVVGVLVNSTAAVFADDAWNIDYHLALLGAPQQHTTFFHQPFADSKASLLYTLSEKAVLGAVNPRDGSLVWRHDLGATANTTSTFLRAGQGQGVVISAVDGELAGWSAADGRQVWSLGLGEGQVKDLEILELREGAEGLSKDAIVLVGGQRPMLLRVDGNTGATKWAFHDDSGDTPYQVSASATEVFYITLHSTMLGAQTVRVTSIDPTSGHKTDQYTLSSDSELSSTANILTVGANSASPIIAWTDKARSVLKVNVVGTKNTASFKIPQVSGQAVEQIVLHAPYQIDSRPHFLVHYQSASQHWAEVYHVDLKTQSVSKAYSLPHLGGKGAFTTSSSDANVYFTRMSESEVSVVSSASHGILARWPLKTLRWHGVEASAAPVHAVTDLSVRADSVSAIRSAVLMSSGDWVAFRDGTVSWTRPEALAETVAAVWAYPQVDHGTVDELEAEAHANPIRAYVHRVTRHVHDLEHLPGYLLTIPSRILSSLGVAAPTTIASASSDPFGYHKTIVCATETGRIIALDVGSGGKVLWNYPASVVTPGSKWVSPQLFARPDGSIEIIHPIDGTSWTLDATTGGQTPTHAGGNSIGPHSSGFAYEIRKDGQLVGHPSDSNLEAIAWQFVPRSPESISSVVARAAVDPVASIGRVLGNRRVLYKYLNPNLLLITAVSASAKTATLSLVDSISGAILFSASHDDVDTKQPIASAVSENWFAYSLGVPSSDSVTKGYQLVVGELYESAIPDDRGPLSGASNFSDLTFGYQPTVLTQTYNIPEPISQMAVTQTKQGITSRQLLAILPESNSVVGIPRAVLDPRRPIDRDPTAAEAMEGLFRYAPVLEFDPKWYLNHQRELFGVAKITTSPAFLESTSLVFVYGLDIFGTRVSPSFSFDVLGKDFNKLQMLATVAALAVGTLIVAPLVRRKQINGRWLFQ